MKRLTHKEAHERLEAMKLYKSEGHTAKEVAEKFGTSLEYAKKICRGIAPVKNQYLSKRTSRSRNYTKETKVSVLSVAARVTGRIMLSEMMVRS